MTIKNYIRPFLNQLWFTLRGDLMKTVQCHLAHLWLTKTPVEGNHSTNLLNYFTSKIKLWLGDAKSERKSIRAGSMLWSSIPMRTWHTKINELINKYIHNWILQHPKVWHTWIYLTNHILLSSLLFLVLEKRVFIPSF